MIGETYHDIEIFRTRLVPGPHLAFAQHDSAHRIGGRFALWQCMTVKVPWQACQGSVPARACTVLLPLARR
jgi:hypothetical protein